MIVANVGNRMIYGLAGFDKIYTNYGQSSANLASRVHWDVWTLCPFSGVFPNPIPTKTSNSSDGRRRQSRQWWSSAILVVCPFLHISCAHIPKSKPRPRPRVHPNQNVNFSIIHGLKIINF